jgi:hypothetical protein
MMAKKSGDAVADGATNEIPGADALASGEAAAMTPVQSTVVDADQDHSLGGSYTINEQGQRVLVSRTQDQ